MKTLILIPVMYSGKDLKKILKMIPEDFEETSQEFWSYVDNKLKLLMERISVVYSDRPKDEEDGKAVALIRILSKATQTFYLIDDPLLSSEAEAWLELSKNQQNQTAAEFYEENMMERDKYTIDIIDKTLEDDKVGVLIIEPTRKIAFPEKIRVIKLCPFDPTDYINRHLVKIEIAKKRSA